MNVADGRVVGTVGEVWRYPVKSMLGERLGGAMVTPVGVEGDRRFGVRDEADGSIISAKRSAVLFGFRSSYDCDGLPRIQSPSGMVRRPDDPELAAELSAALGRTVTLAERRPGEETRIQMASDSDTTEGPSDHFSTQEGLFFDASHLLLLTTATLATLQGLHPDGRWDVRRFRPNFLIEPAGGAGGYVEEAWIGGRVAIGAEAVVDVLRPCTRCVMITHAQDELPTDRDILRTVLRENEQHAGVRADVVTPGRVSVGDAVTLLG